MYILTDDDDGRVGIANYPELEIEDECMVNIYGEGGVRTPTSESVPENVGG